MSVAEQFIASAPHVNVVPFEISRSGLGEHFCS
jgi:hypothetical protein